MSLNRRTEQKRDKLFSGGWKRTCPTKLARPCAKKSKKNARKVEEHRKAV
jgi:hypothetical protein